MRQVSLFRGIARGAVAVVALAASATLAHAQQATVTGRVTDAVSNQPVQSAQVFVVGTNLGQLTSAEGTFTIRGVPTGDQRIRVLRVGYAEQVKPVTVTAGGSATVNFALQPVSVQLAPVVTTATGEQRRVEVGNDIPVINAAKVASTGVTPTVGDLLSSRAPGVQVLNGGSTGAGSRVRIRGTTSLSLSNEPIYVIDGVRMNAATSSTAIGIGGTVPSRINDLNPDEIENIEIVKGPSAATLYGPDAANGVIVITTKRGRGGAPRWSLFTEGGLVTDLNNYPANYTAYGTNTAGPANRCYVWLVASGACTRDSITTFNTLTDPNTTIIGNGYRQQHGLQVSGGTEAVRYFVSGGYENEEGRIHLPQYEQDSLQQLGQSIPGYIMNPNMLQRYTGRANLNLALSSKLDAALSTGLIHSYYRNSQLDNNVNSPFAQGLFGPGTVNTQNYGGAGHGYLNFTPYNIFQYETDQKVNRFIPALNLNYRPITWLAARGNFGMDYTNQYDENLCRFSQCPNFGTQQQGFRNAVRTDFIQYTADASATATFQPMASFNSKTTLGAQYFDSFLQRNGSGAANLPPGATTASQGAVPSASELTSDTRTLGAFVEEALSIRDRLFLTGAIRHDRNSATGVSFKGSTYPKASLSWILSDESFFPRPNWLSQLRLRTSYGESGNLPGTTAALQFFSTTQARLNAADVPGLVLSAPGNAKLKPEVTREFEGGFDGGLFNSRINVQLTYYNKDSRDALIAAQLAPSFGTGNETRFVNLGKVRNWGWEYLVNAQVLQRDAFGWDITVNGARNSNKLVSLGNTPPIIGATISQKEGYPLNGWWTFPIKSFSDANHNGMIDPGEVVVGDTAEFLGYSQPRTEISLTNGFDLFHRRIRLQGLLDYRGDYKVLNGTTRFKCNNGFNCQEAYDPSAPLWQQARAYALIQAPQHTLAGYIENGNFWKLREVSATFNAPDEWASRIRTRSLSLTFAARNLHTWTKYTGIDPESNYGQFDVQQDFLTLPPPSYFILRLNVGF